MRKTASIIQFQKFSAVSVLFRRVRSTKGITVALRIAQAILGKQRVVDMALYTKIEWSESSWNPLTGVRSAPVARTVMPNEWPGASRPWAARVMLTALN